MFELIRTLSEGETHMAAKTVAKKKPAARKTAKPAARKTAGRKPAARTKVAAKARKTAVRKAPVRKAKKAA